MRKKTCIALPVNELIQTALQQTISIFLALVFTTATIVALPVSVALVAVAFPVWVLFKIPKAFATYQILEEQRNTLAYPTTKFYQVLHTPPSLRK